jgi:hypothetical protein
MATYTMMCGDGHDEEKIEVMADDDDSAMAMMMDKMKGHLMEKHSDKQMTDQEVMEHIKTHWQKT